MLNVILTFNATAFAIIMSVLAVLILLGYFVYNFFFHKEKQEQAEAKPAKKDK